MAEAFGFGASIAGVLGVTLQIMQVVVQFGLDWKDAPKDVQIFKTELQGLQTTLSEIQGRLISDPEFAEAFEGHSSTLVSQLGPNALSAMDTRLSIESCEIQLTAMLNSLRKKGQGQRVGWERFKMAFLSEKTRETMKRLHVQCQILSNMVSIDMTKLAALTLNETKRARAEQKEWHKDQAGQRLLDWLSHLDFEDKQMDVLSKRHPGTGEWLFDQDDFLAWRNGHFDIPSIMWCPGIRISSL
jgi:hypothetical protein